MRFKKPMHQNLYEYKQRAHDLALLHSFSTRRFKTVSQCNAEDIYSGHALHPYSPSALTPTGRRGSF